MKSSLLFVALLIPVVMGCQRMDMDANAGDSVESVGTATVRAANGTLYAISCMRENAEEIQARGQSALDQCKINPATGEGRQFHRSRHYFIFWPPTYYNSSIKYHYPSTTSGTTYYYPPATSTSTNTNSFVNYVFGYPTTYNIFALLGYSTSYSSYYQPSCTNSCMYSYNHTCQNKCWSAHSWVQ